MNPTVYLLPKQPIYILCEPLTSENLPFYNSSNVDYERLSLKSTAKDKLGNFITLHKGNNYELI